MILEGGGKDQGEGKEGGEGREGKDRQSRGEG